MTPYTPREEIANIYIIPTFISDTTKPGANGITAHPAILNTIVITGAKRKTTLLEFVGIIFSFVNNFIASAKGWNSPNGPTTFGPLRSCIAPKIFLSA